MRAALYYGPGDVRLEDIPEPDPGPGSRADLGSDQETVCGSD